MKRAAEDDQAKEQCVADDKPAKKAAAVAAEAPSEDRQDAGGGSAGSSGSGEAQVVTNSADFWRVQVEAIYHRRNPHKLSGVPALLEKYAGKEAVLYAKVCKTYDLDPKKFYADAKAWEEYERDTQEPETPASDTTSSGAGLGSLFSGGGVAVTNLFGGLGPVSGPLFAASQAKADKKTEKDSDDSEEDEADKASQSKPKQEECKTQ